MSGCVMTRTNIFVRECFLHFSKEEQSISQDIIVYGHPDILHRLANKTANKHPGNHDVLDRIALLFGGTLKSYDTNTKVELKGWTKEHAFMHVEIYGKNFTCKTMMDHICKCLNDYGLSYQVDEISDLVEQTWVLL